MIEKLFNGVMRGVILFILGWIFNLLFTNTSTQQTLIVIIGFNILIEFFKKD